MTDEKSELAVRWIQRTRQSKQTEVRRFVLPVLSFDASDYHELINWQKFPRTEPPMMMSLQTMNWRVQLKQQSNGN